MFAPLQIAGFLECNNKVALNFYFMSKMTEEFNNYRLKMNEVIFSKNKPVMKRL